MKMTSMTDKLKAKALQTLGADAVVDLTVDDCVATRLWVNKHTPKTLLPAYCGLAALLCANSRVRLHEFDELCIKWNAFATQHYLQKLDNSNDNIVRSMYALFDVCYYDEQTEMLCKNMTMCNDKMCWLEWLKQYVPTLPIGLFYMAEQVKHSDVVI